MLVYPEMLVSAAVDANMLVPKNPNDFIPENYPHFHVFCMLQLGRAMEFTEHWDNAKVIAAIPEAELKTLTIRQFIAKGVRIKGM